MIIKSEFIKVLLGNNEYELNALLNKLNKETTLDIEKFCTMQYNRVSMFNAVGTLVLSNQENNLPKSTTVLEVFKMITASNKELVALDNSLEYTVDRYRDCIVDYINANYNK